MRYTGPKNKLARREGADLGLKTPGSKSHASLLRRLNVLPGQHGIRKRRKLTERSRQLREKQKLRFLFGITESQLKKYFKRAVKMKGNTGDNLCQLLEKRLDNVVYRLGFAPTRTAARQLVGHQHVAVNGKTINIPSYKVSVKQQVAFAKEKTMKIPQVESILANKTIIIPTWLERKGAIGILKAEPTSEEVEKQINLRPVIEFYSR
ncbi:30S ribosomal protein S4 [Candidatus Roizmanbacteria bacterium]|nr:30S ribosomal protein S4 [Candidatus Roizmanbacteria bacterium]